MQYAKILHDFRGMNGDEQLFFIPEGEVGKVERVEGDNFYIYFMVEDGDWVIPLLASSVQFLKTCDNCDTEGWLDGIGEMCDKCKGYGWVE